MITPEKVYLRDYNKIFTGTNQEGGYENPFLSFMTDTVEIEFRADKSTYFHYPHTASTIGLSATDLIENGAFAGSIPYKADKVFKKEPNYMNTTPVSLQNGIWLCAWLSGNDADLSQSPVWMDRWYDPGSINPVSAMFVFSTSAVYDTPSIMNFDPGGWYRYDHVGSNLNEQIVDLIDNEKIHLDSWAVNTTDESGNGNNAILANFSNSMIGPGVNVPERPDDNSLQLDGHRQFATILYSKSFDISATVTSNAWVRFSDWQHPQTQHYVSNGLRGGWSIGANNGFFTPAASILDHTGRLILVNQTGKIYFDNILPGSPAPIKVCRDEELYTWILDNGVYNGAKHLYKMDFNGNIDSAVDFSSAIGLHDFVLNQNGDAWVLTTQSASCYNTYGVLISSVALGGTRLTINQDSVLSSFNALDASVMDDTRYTWVVNNAGDIYTNNVLFLSGMSATNIQCPLGADTYVLYDINKIMKISSSIEQLTNTLTHAVVLTAAVPDTVNSNVSGRNIFFTNEYVNGDYVDYVWVVQPNTNYLYKYTRDLELTKKVNITYVKNSLSDSAIRGDCAGYDWHRLFNYSQLEVPGTPQIEARAYLGTGTPILSAQKYTLSVPVCALSQNDWHMFTFTVDTERDEMKLYMDTVLRDTISIPANVGIYYKYETPLTLGTNIGRIVPLDEETGKIDKLYFTGGIDDVRVYTDALSNSDIRHIYMTKFDFRSLFWNMPTGTQAYIEEILRFFKFKMPGQKSQFYQIRLAGLRIENTETRAIIENIIKDAVQKIAPLYTTLYKITWE